MEEEVTCVRCEDLAILVATLYRYLISCYVNVEALSGNAGLAV